MLQHFPIEGVSKKIRYNSYACVRHFHNFIIKLRKNRTCAQLKFHLEWTVFESGRDCVLITLFHLQGSKAGLFQGNLSGLVSMTPSFPPPSNSKNCWHYLIDADVIIFFQQVMVKKSKKMAEILKTEGIQFHAF